MITCLAGGVGAARFLKGLVNVVDPEQVVVIVNTGDDMEFLGLRVSPDLDTIMYTLAGIVDEERGWGLRDDTFNFLEMVGGYGFETWFKVGDRDLATHVIRSMLLRRGLKLSEVTDTLRRALGVRCRIVPMSDETVQTRVITEDGALHFQEYYVKHEYRKKFLGVIYEGIERAKPAPGVLESISDADVVIFCPSNPVVSIGTILSVKGVREAIEKTRAKRIAISPLIGGRPVKGPADVMLRALGFEPSSYGVASFYRGLIDILVMDVQDSDLKDRVEELGVRAVLTNTLMRSLEDKIRLARAVLEAASRS